MKDKVRTRKTPKPKTSGTKRKPAKKALRESKRKKAEEIKEKEKYFLQLIENAPIAMTVDSGVDEDEKGIMMNKKFTELFGYTAEDVPDVRYWWPLAYPDAKYREEIKAEWVRRVEKAVRTRSEIEPMETQVTCKDGSIRDIKVYLASIGDKNLVTFEDLTERKRAEEAVHKSEQAKTKFLVSLNEAQEVGKIGSCDMDWQTNNVWWSEETYRIFGVTPQEFVPSFEANGKFIHPDDFEKYVKSFEHILQSGELLNIDLRLVTNDGLVKPCNVRGKVIYDDSGKPIRFIGTIMDITERKKAEEALRESKTIMEAVIENAPT